MRYLIDTHLLVWSAHTPERLPPKAMEIFENHGTLIVVSMASLWEAAIKAALGKLHIHHDFIARVESSQASILDIKTHHLRVLGNLPHHHGDPFDRLLIAQAQCENLTLITCDRHFEAYQGIAKIILA